MEEFLSINERVAVVVIKLKIVQAYAPTPSYDDESVYSFYEDVKSAMN